MSTDLNKLLKRVKKIAVLRANALGDFIFILPAVRALRETYPHAEIVLLAKQWHADFVPGHVPDIDRVVAIPPCPGVGEPEGSKADDKEVQRFFSAMQQESFDLAFQMHGGGRYSNAFTLQLGAEYTVGSKTPDAAALDISIPYRFYQNEVLRYLELASYVNAKTSDISPAVTVTSDDVSEAAALTGSQQYLVIHPGASDPRRRWPAKKFAAVAEHFLQKDYRVFVTGTTSEREVVEAVVTETRNKASSLCGELSLGGLAGLTANAALTISNDTGPLHLARAVGGRTLGIYWAGNYITAGPMQLATHASLLSWAVHCPVCGKKCISSLPFEDSCHHTTSFVDDVTSEQVIKEAMRLLQ